MCLEAEETLHVWEGRTAVDDPNVSASILIVNTSTSTRPLTLQVTWMKSNIKLANVHSVSETQSERLVLKRDGAHYHCYVGLWKKKNILYQC